jgi:hypothetical protein
MLDSRKVREAAFGQSFPLAGADRRLQPLLSTAPFPEQAGLGRDIDFGYLIFQYTL